VPASEKPLNIDIPVKLSDVKVVFSIGALEFEGDLPASIFHLQLIKNDIGDWNAESQVIAVFHTNAGSRAGACCGIHRTAFTRAFGSNVQAAARSHQASLRLARDWPSHPNEPGGLRVRPEAHREALIAHLRLR
jgi:hypothetical protein